MVGGVSAADPAGLGEGGGGRACPMPGQAGQAGVGAPVAGGCAVGTEQAAARGCRTGRVAGVLGLGGRPRCVVVVEPAARVDGPGRADGLAGGNGRAAPARPRLAASIRGLLPTAL